MSINGFESRPRTKYSSVRSGPPQAPRKRRNCLGPAISCIPKWHTNICCNHQKDRKVMIVMQHYFRRSLNFHFLRAAILYASFFPTCQVRVVRFCVGCPASSSAFSAGPQLQAQLDRSVPRQDPNSNFSPSLDFSLFPFLSSSPAEENVGENAR